MTVHPRLAAAAVLAAVLPLAACATPPPPRATLVVRIAEAAHPAAYEVHLAQSQGAYRSMRTMRTGETRTFSVPRGWVTVRVAGVCVVPTPAAGTTTVDVRPDDCRVA